MGRKSKYSLDEKLEAIRYCLDGKGSTKSYSRISGISARTLRYWIRNYQSAGIAGITDAPTQSRYSAELKIEAVKEYLAGGGSYDDICKKYRVRSTYQLQDWVLKYNGHKELKSSRTGGTALMTKGRKTTYAERLEIVEYCISAGLNYSAAAKKYQVSYQQVYQWAKKYEANGIRGLSDNRGKRKPESEMSELEKLRVENRLLLAEKKKAEMEIELLKKVEEIERRRY